MSMLLNKNAEVRIADFSICKNKYYFKVRV